jgi:hypothetical protein
LLVIPAQLLTAEWLFKAGIQCLFVPNTEKPKTLDTRPFGREKRLGFCPQTARATPE